MNQLIKKHKKVWKTLSYTEHLLILACALTECVSISDFDYLLVILVGITSFTAAIRNMCNKYRN